MEHYTLTKYTRMKLKGEGPETTGLPTVYNGIKSYSFNLWFAEHGTDRDRVMWHCKEEHFRHLQLDEQGRCISLLLDPGTIFVGDIDNKGGWSLFTGGPSVTKPATAIPEPPPNPVTPPPKVLEDAFATSAGVINRQDLTIDDIVDLHAYLMAKTQNTLSRLGLEPKADVCNSCAATVMIDIQKRGLPIPTKVRE